MLGIDSFTAIMRELQREDCSDKYAERLIRIAEKEAKKKWVKLDLRKENKLGFIVDFVMNEIQIYYTKQCQ